MQKQIDIFIGGSTNKDISNAYHDIAIELGKKINQRDYNVIFDGCCGLPFLVFNELEDSSRGIIYITRFYHYDYMYNTHALIHQFRDQSDFLRHIPVESDAMIFMKGGTSTIAEIMYAIETKKNKEHDKPIVIFNINNEWSELVNLLNTLGMNELYYVADNVIDALNYIESELYKETSRFYNHYVKWYMERKQPIIESNLPKKSNRI